MEATKTQCIIKKECVDKKEKKCMMPVPVTSELVEPLRRLDCWEIAPRERQIDICLEADFWVCRVDVRPFRPEEVTYTICRDTELPCVLIKCRRNRNGNILKAKRKIVLPRFVDIRRVRVEMTREYTIIIRAPLTIPREQVHIDELNYYRTEDVEEQRRRFLSKIPTITTKSPFALEDAELLKKSLWKTVVPVECFETKSLSPEMKRLQEEMRALRREMVPRGMDLVRLVRLPNREYEIRMDFFLTLFKPEEVKCTVNKRTVVIEARREAKLWESEVCRTHFVFEFPVPRCCEVERLHSELRTVDGRFRVTMPCVFKEELPLEGKIVPVVRKA